MTRCCGFTGDADADLFFRQGGFQVEDDFDVLAVGQGPDGPAAELVGDAAFQPVFREAEFSLFALDTSAVHQQLEADILERLADEFRIVAPGQQRRFAGEGRGDAVARFRREVVAVSGRTGHRVGAAAGGHDHGAEAGQVGEASDACPVADVHTQVPDPPLERAGYIACHQRGGEDPLPLQRDGRHAQFFLEEADEIFVREGPEGLFQETLVGMDVR